MRILVISQNFYPDHFQINQITRDWVAAGHEVTVLTGLGDYTTSHINPRYQHGQHRNEQYDGVNIHRVRAIARHHGPIWRSLNYLSFALNGWLWVRRQQQQFDIVYVYEVSPITQVIPALGYTRKHHVPLAVYVLDIWPEAVKAMHINEGTLPFKIIHKLSRYLYQAADGLAVSSPSFTKYLRNVDDIQKSIEFIPQYANPIDIIKVKPAFTKLPGVVDFVFTGNIGLVQDLETVIYAVKHLIKAGLTEQFRVHLIGDGSNLSNLKKLVNTYHLEKNIIFYGRQPSTKMASYYAGADACLLTLSGANRIGWTIPVKLQNYLAAGKPIIAAIDGDAQTIIKTAQCGLYTNAGNSNGLATRMQQFIELKPAQRSLMGQRGKQYFMAHYQRQQFNKHILTWLNSLVTK